jgi:hypothetical protein
VNVADRLAETAMSKLLQNDLAGLRSFTTFKKPAARYRMKP